MAMTGRERQARYRERKRTAEADLEVARAEIERLTARVADLERERDRLDDLVGLVLKREEWAEAERRATEAAPNADDDAMPPAPKITGRCHASPAPFDALPLSRLPSRPPSTERPAHAAATARRASCIPPWLLSEGR